MTTIYKVFDGNVANVLLTADHGFLYNDMKFEEKDKHSIKESAIEKKTRYYLTDSNDAFEDIVKFPLDKVSSIKSTTPLQVAVPIGTKPPGCTRWIQLCSWWRFASGNDYSCDKKSAEENKLA